MSQRVFVIDENVVGEVINLLAYGAYVKYTVGGIEYKVYLSDEDYLTLEY